MESVAAATGAVLRQMRTERGYTLKQAAKRMSLSIASLSRLERGLRAPKRSDLEAATGCYELTPWENNHLYNVSGLLPGAMPRPEATAYMQHALEALRNLCAPAFLVDRLGYFLAWNDAARAMLNLTEAPPLHPLDELFSPFVREAHGDGWHAFALRTVRLFYARSLPLSQDADFRRLMSELVERYGAEFMGIWSEAQAPSLLELNEDGSGLPGVDCYMTAAGPVDYLLTMTLLGQPSMMELFVFVPYGAESIARQREMDRQNELGRVHTSHLLHGQTERGASKGQ